MKTYSVYLTNRITGMKERQIDGLTREQAEDHAARLRQHSFYNSPSDANGKYGFVTTVEADEEPELVTAAPTAKFTVAVPFADWFGALSFARSVRRQGLSCSLLDGEDLAKGWDLTAAT